MDWIQWKPQGRYEGPIDDWIWCEVLMVDGEKDQAFSGDFNWGVEDEPGEIIAYRLPTLIEAAEKLYEKETP